MVNVKKFKYSEILRLSPQFSLLTLFPKKRSFYPSDVTLPNKKAPFQPFHLHFSKIACLLRLYCDAHRVAHDAIKSTQNSTLILL